MEILNGTIQSKVDCLELSTLEAVPDGTPRGVLQLVHGMSENKERYLPFMEYMAEHGFAVIIHDHRGHGKSVKKESDLGYMYAGRGKALVEDVRTVNENVHRKYPGIPVVLFGHSMGSLTVRAYLKKYDNTVDMTVVCGTPAKHSLPVLAAGRGIAKVQKLFKGPKHRSKLIETMSFGSYAARFAEEKNRFAWICSNPEVVEEYERSPYCGFTFTTDAYEALFDLLRETYSNKGWRCNNAQMPILLVSGSDDPCMGNVRKFKYAVNHLRHVGYRDVKGKLYPGMRHEILNEKDKEKVYRDLYKYIVKKLQGAEV